MFLKCEFQHIKCLYHFIIYPITPKSTLYNMSGYLVLHDQPRVLQKTENKSTLNSLVTGECLATIAQVKCCILKTTRFTPVTQIS